MTKDMDNIYTKPTKTHDYLAYCKLPLEFNLPASKKALTRAALLDALTMLIAVVNIPIVSSFICNHPIMMLAMITFLAIASVQVREPIVSFNCRATAS